jgi:hypothetical protein
MKSRIITPFDMIVIGIVLLLIVVSFGWAVSWYWASSCNESHFTPGDLGSSMNIAMTLGTLLLAYLAYRAYAVSRHQLLLLQADQTRQSLEPSFSSAIAEFARRSDVDRSRLSSVLNERDSFLKAYEACKRFKEDKTGTEADVRFTHFRTANFVLKPIAYWCRWVEKKLVDADDTLDSDLEIFAYRILASMTSTVQVYLIMCHMMETSDIKVKSQGYDRVISYHEYIYSFLQKHAATELEDCRTSNAGQIKVIEDLIEHVGWHSNTDVRDSFFKKPSTDNAS